MKEKQQLEDLYLLYLKNQSSKEEFELFFETLNSGEDDNEILELMSDSWDNTHAVPDVGLSPGFLKFDAKQVKLHERLARTIPLHRWINVAAAMLIFTAGLYFFRSALVGFFNPVHQLQSWSASGERKKIQLEDGSLVWLGPNSKLIYPDRFKEKQRTVSLDGEAFFEVAHDVDHPFIIRTGKVNTVVLGTSFNVFAYRKQKTVNVTLVSGKVAVTLSTKDRTHTERILPNQQVIVDENTGKIIKINYPGAASFLDRRVGKYEYKGAALKEVARDIESQYNLRVGLDGSLSDKIFYGNLDMNAPASETLKKLCLIMELKCERKGDRYEIIK